MFMIFATNILSLFSGRPHFQTPPATSAGADGPTAPGTVFLQDGAKRSTPDRIIPPKGWFTTKNPLWTWMIWRSPFRKPPLLCWGVPKSWENPLNSIVQKIKKSPCLAWWVFMIFGQAKQNAFLEGKEFACFFVGTLKSCSTAMPLWPWRVEVDC